jgi:hypothetical protein
MVMMAGLSPLMVIVGGVVEAEFYVTDFGRFDGTAGLG